MERPGPGVSRRPILMPSRTSHPEDLLRTTVQVAQKGLTLTCDYHPIYTYAALSARQQPVSSITLQPTGTGAPVHGILGLAIPEMNYVQNLRTEELGGSIPPGGLATVATELELEKATVRIQGNLESTLDEEPVDRLPINFGHGRQDTPLIGYLKHQGLGPRRLAFAH